MLQGAVNVSVTAIIPSDRDTADVIPGDFSTVNAAGEPEMLESAGKWLYNRKKTFKNFTRSDYIYNAQNKAFSDNNEW